MFYAEPGNPVERDSSAGELSERAALDGEARDVGGEDADGARPRCGPVR